MCNQQLSNNKVGHVLDFGLALWARGIKSACAVQCDLHFTQTILLDQSCSEQWNAWDIMGKQKNALIQSTSKMCPVLNAPSYSRKMCPIDAADIDAIIHSLIPSPIPSKYILDKLVGEIPVNILNRKIYIDGYDRCVMYIQKDRCICRDIDTYW